MRLVVAALLAVALVAPTLAWAGTTTHETRRIDRALASPFPLGPLSSMSDRATWRVEVPTGTTVEVDAGSTATSVFYLEYGPMGGTLRGSPLPATRQVVLLLGPGDYAVRVDPAAGADVHIVIDFSGHYSTSPGKAAPFTLTNVGFEFGCLRPEVCLP